MGFPSFANDRPCCPLQKFSMLVSKLGKSRKNACFFYIFVGQQIFQTLELVGILIIIAKMAFFHQLYVAKILI
jgi:hypothetical protein